MVKKIRVIENDAADTSTSLTMSDADFRVNRLETVGNATSTTTVREKDQ